MKRALDKFSAQSETYRKFRPIYPEALYGDILTLVPSKGKCWDCGTGNGQVAVALSEHFESVSASDLSAQQIAHAEKRDNIVYSVERAENTGFSSDQFDLITVAQAFHWFDFRAFNQEAKRVSKNGGIVGIWGYGLLRISEPLDLLVDHFYHQVVGPYWDRERRHVDNRYESVPFDFEPIDLVTDHAITVHWDLRHLEGYFNSWSSVQNYMKENSNKNPVSHLMKDLAPLWKGDVKKEVTFPIFMKLGRVVK